MTVLPVPKPPGMIALPPSATGKNVSRMRIPVMNGVVGSSLRLYGRPVLTGHHWLIVISVPSSSRATTSSIVYEPGPTIVAMVPFTSGGTITRWITVPPSGVVPITSPPDTFWPTVATGVKSHFLDRSRALATVPRVMKSLPVSSAMTGRGRWMPS